MGTCLGCDAQLVKRQVKYCSIRCQQAVIRSRRLAEWLATGKQIHASKRGHYIRDHLFEAQGGRCGVCAMAAEWNGEPIQFVLDHVDGDASNNRRENLRLICPNCDSQLPTYKSRNRGRGRAWRKQRYADGKSY
ncbi:HNH endonuclease [Nocardioides panacihumi]|uniref:HNH endonuclease n=1 Tax=Nocardioides panacihumi TaxID=400774 RepID=A0ABN2Q709_9ACTN